MRNEEIRQLVEGLIETLAKALKTQVHVTSEVRAGMHEAVRQYGAGRITDYVVSEVRRLRDKPDLYHLLAPSSLFAPATLHDRFVVATADLSASDPNAVAAEKQGGSTRCSYLDDALPVLRRLLSRDEYEAVMRWDTSERPESGWNRIRLRATVHDRAGKLVTEQDMREAKPSRQAMDVILGRADCTKEIAGELDDWERWTTGRTIRLRAIDMRHENALRRNLRAFERALSECFHPDDRELIPRVAVQPAAAAAGCATNSAEGRT